MAALHMKISYFGLILALILVLSGCASQGWQSADIPLPRSTPYDSNQFARNAYLDGYRSGYRAQQNGDRGVSLMGGPYQDAQLHGFQAGAAQARAQMTGEVPPVSPAETNR